MMMLYWCTLVLLTLVPVVTGVNTGVTVILTKTGLDLVSGKAAEMLKHKDIPDKTFLYEQYKFTGMKTHINELKVVQELVPSTGVTLTIKGAGIQVTGNLGSEPLNVNVDTLNITATVAFKSDEKTGHLKLSIENCEAKIGTIEVNTGSKILDNISKVPLLTWVLGKWGCSKMETILNNQLATIYDKVRELTGIDFSMQHAVISKDSIELRFESQNGQKKRRSLEETKTLLRINI